MANYSSEIDTLIRAYFRGKLTEMEQKNFENRLQTDIELSEAFALEQESRKFFKAYTYHKMQEANLIIKAIEKNNPLVVNASENIDNQPNENKKKWIGLGFLLLICLASFFYISSNKKAISTENNPTSEISQNINVTPETLNDSDSVANNPIGKDTSPKSKVTVKIPQQNSPFADSLKSYLSFEKEAKKAQNELVTLLLNNVTINRNLIDTLKALTNCEHQKNNFSLAPPKFSLLSDSLVLDSIRLTQIFPAPPQNIGSLQTQKNKLLQWEKLDVFRKKEAWERNEALQKQLKRFGKELRACRK